MEVVDLNGDGRKDLVLGNTEGQLWYFANVGTDAAPQFAGSQLLLAAGVTIDLDGQPRSRPVVADLNGDDVLDLLVGSADGTLRLYVGSRARRPRPPQARREAYAYAFRVPVAGNPTPWQCPLHPLDVNYDGRLTPLDVLVVINYLNVNGAGLAHFPGADMAPPPYLDCTGDGNVTPLDVLQVINDQNASGPHLVPGPPSDNCDTSPTCGPEGEAPARRSPWLRRATPLPTRPPLRRSPSRRARTASRETASASGRRCTTGSVGPGRHPRRHRFGGRECPGGLPTA